MYFFSAIAALLLPAAIMAAPPAHKPAIDNDQCTPTSYVLTEYIHKRSPTYHFVSFNIESTYTADSVAIDPIAAGANCEADGVDLPSSKECSVANEKTPNLVFALREGSDIASYRITHTWICNNATWVAGNNIKLDILDCSEVENDSKGDIVTCTSKPVIFSPQNAHPLVDGKARTKDSKSKDCLKC